MQKLEDQEGPDVFITSHVIILLINNVISSGNNLIVYSEMRKIEKTVNSSFDTLDEEAMAYLRKIYHKQLGNN